jgi:hypothetical protein
MFWQIQGEQEDFAKIDEFYVETGCGRYVHAKSELLNRWREELQDLS